MISTSNEWKKLYKPRFDENGDLEPDSLFLPESNVNIICNNDVVDTSNWTIKTSKAASISNAAKLLSSSGAINREEKKIASLEWNFWVLDGSYEVPTESTKFNGYISDAICDERRVFSEPPQITISSSQKVLKDYATLKFAYGLSEYATDCTIQSNNEQSVYVMEEYDDPYIHISIPGDESGSFTLSIIKWSMPYRRARISEFLVGLRIFFDKSNLSKFTHQRTTDMVCAELPQNDCNFSVLDIDCDWDVDNKYAKYANMVNSNTIFALYYGYKLESGWDYKQVDVFYLESLDRPQNGIEANFKLESNINRKTQTFFDTATDNDNYNWTSYDKLIQFIAQKSGTTISRTGGNFASSVKDKLCKDYIRPTQKLEYYKRPMKEWLQLVAAVINTFILRNPDGTFTLKGLVNTTGAITNKTVIDNISLDLCFSYPEIERISEIGKIVLAMLTIPEYRTSTSIDSNWSDPNVGTGTTVIYPPSRQTKIYGNGVEQTAENKIIALGPNPSSSLETPPMFTISDGLHTSYMNYLYTFISGARKIKVNCIVNPAWQVGDLISMELKNGTYANGYIIDIDVEYSGLIKGNVTILAPKSLNS
ncbi:MAG: hypothetical protein ACLRZ9_05900 [Eubacterium sp.]